MKNIFLASVSTAALLIAAPALAQNNTSTASQSGNAQNASK